MKTMSPIVITATWDPEAGLWVAESEQLPLVTEAPTIDGLMAKLPGIIRDLLELEDFAAGDEAEVPFEVVAHMHETVGVRRRRA
jgi:hypothetical protein